MREGDAVRPLERDPIDLLAAMLDRLEIMRDTMAGLVQSTENELVIVAAAREWRHVEKELRDLLMAVGKIPRDLGRIAFALEAREAARLLDRLLDDLESGGITPAQARASMAQWAGIEQTVIEGTALAVA